MRRCVTAAAAATMLVLPATQSRAQPSVYCNGATAADTFGRHYYPNGQLIQDEFGMDYYPNGRAVRDTFGRIYYPNGQVVRDEFQRVHYPNGQVVKDDFGVYYPNGQIVRDDFGCYWSTGVPMQPCQAWVPLRVDVPGFGAMNASLNLQTGLLSGPLGTAEVPFYESLGSYGIEADVDLGRGVVTAATAVCGA